MPKNQDNSPPNLVPISTWPISFKQFVDGSAHVYWLPGQYMNNDDQYYFVESEIPKNPTLHIPKVGRFIYSFGSGDDISAYCTAVAEDCHGTGGGGITPECLVGSSVEVQRNPIPGTGVYYDGQIVGLPVIGFDRSTGRTVYLNTLGPGVCGLTFIVRFDAEIILTTNVTLYRPLGPGYPTIFGGVSCCYPPPPLPPPTDCGSGTS